MANVCKNNAKDICSYTTIKRYLGLLECEAHAIKYFTQYRNVGVLWKCWHKQMQNMCNTEYHVRGKWCLGR